MLAAGPALADAPGAPLRLYLRARASGAGAAYAEALAADPASALVAVRAYRAGLRSGDIALAERAAAVLDRAGVAPPDAALLPLARAAAAGDAAAVERALPRLARTPLAMLVPSLRGWIARARGRDATAAAIGADGVARRLDSENRVLLLAAGGRAPEALAALRALSSAAVPLDLRVAAAQLLAGQGRPAEARAAMARSDAVVDRLTTPAGGAVPSLGFGLSRLLTRVAADLGSDGPSPLEVAMGRAALVAEPANMRARLVLADALARDGAEDEALAVLDAVPLADPFAPAAAAARVTVLSADGRTDEALSAARRLADADGAGAADWQRLAQLRAATGQWGDAAALYRRVAASGEGRDDWTAWMQYGEALERAGRWAQAREALERAVALAPDEPLALNFLGYATAEHGEDMGRARRLLERAARLRPDDTSIADSLGWVYHLGGETARGLPLIERAAADQPASAEIAEHLGDAYWAVGRRFEARYAWAAAATVADTGAAARLRAKAAAGPDGPSARR